MGDDEFVDLLSTARGRPADLVGFSSWALEAGDQQAVRLLRDFSKAVEPPILERRGEVVKRLGDGLMGVGDRPGHRQRQEPPLPRQGRARGPRGPRDQARLDNRPASAG